MMRSMNLWCGACMVAALVGLTGCQGAQRSAPHMHFGGAQIHANLERDDLEIMPYVEGTSSTQSILGPVVQIIDGEKLKVLGIPFYTEKYTKVNGLPWITTDDRAYYDALAKAPKRADAVFAKTMERETGGIPILFANEQVTFRGRAFRVKRD